MRRQATVALNKGESRNAIARAVCFHRLRRLRDRTTEAQQHRASGLALDAARRRGEVVPDNLLAHLAPLGWQHVSLTGDYLWDAKAVVGQTGSGHFDARRPQP